MATRVLIADKLPPAARTRLQSAGFEVQADASLKDESLLEALKGFQPAALIVRSTKVTAAHVEAASELQLVVRAGAGVNTIDLDAASSRGVYVSNCPGMNAVAVAELAWGHIINADRQIADNVSDLRQGQWRKKTYGKAGRGLKGRTLGVVGCGAIGKAVIARALAFEMDVFAWSPSLTPKKAKRLGVRYADDAVEVARQADVLTVHVALTPATRGFIGEAIFEAMRPGSILINTTRGEVLDEAALARAVREKGIRAGLDVFCGEPSSDGEWRTPLADMPGVYGTHHIAASTLQAQEAVADEACRVVEQWQSTGQAPNCVNLARVTPATHMLVVRHADEVGVLAHVLGALSAAQINVQQMENIIFSGDEGAACARVQVEGHPGETLVSEIKGHPHVLDVGVVEI
ncbi:MAG: NAD(P)-dependent oxidoreductase [Bradymonadia bacterium]